MSTSSPLARSSSSITGERRTSIMMVLEQIDSRHVGKEYPNRIENYTLLECIGEGTEGVVWKAFCNTNKTTVAIKIVDLERAPSELIEDVLREAKVMNENNHPNLVQYHTSFLHESSLWMVMDYMGAGSLADILKDKYPNGMPEVLAASVLKAALRGLEHLHHNQRIHRDFKSDNVLIGTSGQIEVADFGVTAILEKNQPNQRKTVVGTPCWMAPEIITEKGYNQAVDIWSFGITAIELIRGKPPLCELPPNKVFMALLFNAPPSLQAEVDKGTVSLQYKEMVDKCLQREPSKRPTASKLLDNKAFKIAKKSDYIMSHLLHGLSPPEDRFRKSHGNVSPPSSGSNSPISSRSHSPDLDHTISARAQMGQSNDSVERRPSFAKSSSAIDLKVAGNGNGNFPRASSHPIDMNMLEISSTSSTSSSHGGSSVSGSPPDTSEHKDQKKKRSPTLASKDHRKSSIFSHLRRSSITKLFSPKSHHHPTHTADGYTPSPLSASTGMESPVPSTHTSGKHSPPPPDDHSHHHFHFPFSKHHHSSNSHSQVM
eukprot:gene7762-9104_t